MSKATMTQPPSSKINESILATQRDTRYFSWETPSNKYLVNHKKSYEHVLLSPGNQNSAANNSFSTLSTLNSKKSSEEEGSTSLDFSLKCSNSNLLSRSGSHIEAEDRIDAWLNARGIGIGDPLVTIDNYYLRRDKEKVKEEGCLLASSHKDSHRGQSSPSKIGLIKKHSLFISFDKPQISSTLMDRRKTLGKLKGKKPSIKQLDIQSDLIN